MAATVKDLLGAATTAARNQEAARNTAQATAAQIAAQRGTTGSAEPNQGGTKSGEQS